ncbi:MAG: caspase family protein [Actinomycetota bacterium]|nr:caspase family protein [Actinomycetota bacterium]
MGDKSALLVACGVYEDPKFKALRAPSHDADGLAEVLGDPAIGGYAVTTIVDQPFWDVNEAIEGFFADRGREDLLVLYFACHGVKDEDGRLYFAAANTKFRRLASTGVSSAWVNERMDRSRSRRIVLLLDCCYSGAFARGLAPRSGEEVVAAEHLGGRGRAVITASDAMEYAYEGDDLLLDAGSPSVFTGALIQGLRTGGADRDGDGRVGVEELYEYLHDKVREALPSQTPTMSTHGLQGELYVAANPNPPVRPAPLPFELRQAAESELEWQRQGAVVGIGRLLSSRRPGLAEAAREALTTLAGDESPAVAAAARQALGQTASEDDQATAATARSPEAAQEVPREETEAAEQPVGTSPPRRPVQLALARAARVAAAGAVLAVLAPLSSLPAGYGLNVGILWRDVLLAGVGLAGAALLVRARRTWGVLVGVGLVACFTLAMVWLVVVGWILHPNTIRPAFVLRHASAACLLAAVVLCARSLPGLRPR